MKIGIIAPNDWPVPSPTHNGNIVIGNLVQALDEMGHRVNFYAPRGSFRPPKGHHLYTACNFGGQFPSNRDCEIDCLNIHHDALLNEDIVHDLSETKYVAETLFKQGKKNVICTLTGRGGENFDLISNMMSWNEIKNAKTLHAGVDTDFFIANYKRREEWLLWMNRWHPANGYVEAIQLAKETGIKLVVAGTHPDNEKSEDAQKSAFEAINMATGIDGIRFEWLHEDPHHFKHRVMLYRLCRGFLHMTYDEAPFSLGVQEALGCGTPVIVNYNTPSAELVIEGKSGFICQEWNHTIASIHAIEQIDPKMCRDEAITRFDYRFMAEKYLALYQEVIEGKMW